MELLSNYSGMNTVKNADRHTRREEEVLLLLAQRKTLPDIERELYVSNSTARTHCKNIYKKLGVHKREELLVMMGHPSVGKRAE